jgi:hypothetical protein
VLDLLVDAATLLLGVLERGLEQAGVLLLLGGGEDEGGVGRRVLGLVLSDRFEVSLQNRVVFLVSALVKERGVRGRKLEEQKSCSNVGLTESETTTVPEALSCSRELDILRVLKQTRSDCRHDERDTDERRRGGRVEERVREED